jgi:3-methylcrotonyl-CoA carboxylase alpha subunit
MWVLGFGCQVSLLFIVHCSLLIDPVFKKILIANRGEIAQRLFSASRELGVATVAIYSEADADAPWVKMADEAHPLGGVTASDSYLNQEKILAIAQRTGAQAIHPGYGFLSENAAFAANCAAHGVKFIGPSPEAMRQMGSKANARQVAVAAGVPVIPGVDGLGKTADELAQAAEALGYPVLIKASAGGGGKGMRVVDDPAGFMDALMAAQNEARNSFGDEHVILEKYFPKIHHVEVQVLGDEHGRVLHLFERECSIQRRHQKIIEESPSPTIDHETRQRICAAAVKLAQAVGYSSAGTVEFMYTGDGNFYLLEMNTRLQVEHPITEAVTGLDLAQWQIRIAAGEPLPFSQEQLTQRGHAIECRIYAEDPAQNFLPSIGELIHVQWPQGPRVRVDAGVQTGSVVSPYYDPMLAKIITWGEDRRAAVNKMVDALRHTAVLGVTTNISYLLAILQEPHFQRGETTTNYLAEHWADWAGNLPRTAQEEEDLWLAVAAFEAIHGRGSGTSSNPLPLSGAPHPLLSPWQTNPNWRNV